MATAIAESSPSPDPRRFVAAVGLGAEQPIRRHVAQLKLNWSVPTPTPLEKLLADRIAAAWLGVHHAEMTEAFGDASGGNVALASQISRFLDATKALAVAPCNGWVENRNCSHSACPEWTRRPVE